jgi:hypothetical protein
MTNTQAQTEVARLMEVLEDAYWRLKDLDIEDLAEEGDVLGEGLDDKVTGIINGLDEFFA